MGRLQDRVAIVTGAAQGLGEAIARRLAVEGCRGVTIADMNAEKAQAVANAIAGEYGNGTLGIKTNVASETDAAEMVSQTVEKFGAVDILVANAGILKSGDIAEISSAEWRAVIEVNLIGYFLCAQ